MLTSTTTRWKPKVLQALDSWLAIDPVWVDGVIQSVGLTRDLFATTILGIIQHESGGNANAVGDGQCSYGLMQFNWCIRQSPAGQRELQYPIDLGNGEVELRTAESHVQLFDPSINIAIGMKYFLTMLDRFKDVPLAIEAYNNPSRGFFNQPYLDSVLDALGFTAEFFEGLKKKPFPSFSWQQLLSWLSGWRASHGGKSPVIYYAIDLDDMRCVGADNTLVDARKRCATPGRYTIAAGVLWFQKKRTR